jgi:hypothetical protein
MKKYPLLFLLICLSEVKAQDCEFNYVLNWRDYLSLGVNGGWPGGALNYTVTETDGNPLSVISNFSVTGNTSILVEQSQSTSFVSSPWVSSFFYQSAPSLTLATELTEMRNGESITLNVTFSKPVQNLNFILQDVDANTSAEAGADRQEVIIITGIDEPSNTTVSPIMTAGSANTVSGNTAIGQVESDPSSTNGNVGVNFSGYSISAISITFSVQNIVGTPSGNAEPGFGIGNFTYCLPMSALPVTLASFEGRVESGNIAELSWETAQESNTDYFDLEVSEDGKIFLKHTTKMAAGHSDTRQTYVSSHVMQAQRTYYRLKMVDKDGTFSYSKILSLTSNATSQLVSFGPNPFSERLHVRHLGISNGFVELIDSNGSVAAKQRIQTDALTEVETKSLGTGIYTLRIVGDDATPQGGQPIKVLKVR